MYIYICVYLIEDIDNYIYKIERVLCYHIYIPGAAYTCFFLGGNLKTCFFFVIWKKPGFFKKTVFFDFHLKGQIYHELNDSGAYM